MHPFLDAGGGERKMFAKWISTAGISMALVGVIILFMYGMPFRVKTEGITYIVTEQIDEAEVREDAR